MVAAVAPALDEGYGIDSTLSSARICMAGWATRSTGPGLLFMRAPIGRPPFRKSQARVWSPTMPGRKTPTLKPASCLMVLTRTGL